MRRLANDYDKLGDRAAERARNGVRLTKYAKRREWADPYVDSTKDRRSDNDGAI